MTDELLWLIFVAIAVGGASIAVSVFLAAQSLGEVSVYLKSVARNTDQLTQRLEGIEWEVGRIADRDASNDVTSEDFEDELDIFDDSEQEA